MALIGRLESRLGGVVVLTELLGFLSDGLEFRAVPFAPKVSFRRQPTLLRFSGSGS